MCKCRVLFLSTVQSYDEPLHSMCRSIRSDTLRCVRRLYDTFSAVLPTPASGQKRWKGSGKDVSTAKKLSKTLPFVME